MTPAYPEYPIVRANEHNHFELVEDYRVFGIRIPPKKQSDGLTLKVSILKLIVNKYQPILQPAYFTHDYICDLELYALADLLFDTILRESNKRNKLSTKMLYSLMAFMVKKYHKVRYNIVFNRQSVLKDIKALEKIKGVKYENLRNIAIVYFSSR